MTPLGGGPAPVATGRFGGRVAVVTGGGSGLGEAIAALLGALSAHVVVVDIDADTAAHVATAITDGGGHATAVTADVTQEPDVVEIVRIAEAAGGLHGLVLSAAVEVRANLDATTDEDWQRVIDVNLKGPFLCMKHAIPAIRRTGGSIVALGSTLGAIGNPGYAAYCASKGALVNLCKQAAIEEAPHGVRVNVVSPSACDTGLFQRVVAASEDPDALERFVAGNVPMGRLGTAADVSEAVLYLLGDESSYVSGTVLALDGGLAARRV